MARLLAMADIDLSWRQCLLTKSDEQARRLKFH